MDWGYLLIIGLILVTLFHIGPKPIDTMSLPQYRCTPYCVDHR